MNRLRHSLISDHETKFLDFAVKLIPQRLSPDHMTALGLVGAVLTSLAYALTTMSPLYLWLATLGLILHWLGDSLDGYLARYRKTERPKYGFYLDQNSDVIANTLVGLGLACSPFIRTEAALIALLGYQALTIYALIDFEISRVFRVTVAYSGPTEVRILLVLMNLLILMFGAPTWVVFGISFHWCDLTLSAFGLGCFITFLTVFIKNLKPLRDQDDATRRSE